MRTSLYRHFDEAGELLYVGVSLNHVARLGQHSKSASWFEQIASITIEHFMDRASAIEAEKVAIKSEAPRYNVVHVKETLDDRVHREKIEAILEPLSSKDRASLLALIRSAFGVSDPSCRSEVLAELNKVKNMSKGDLEISNPESVRRWAREGYDGLQTNGGSTDDH